MTEQPQPPAITTPVVATSGPPLTPWQRLALTYRYHGPASIAWRVITFPLRFTPLRGYVAPRSDPAEAARRWYRLRGRPVTIAITGGDDRAASALESRVRATTDARRVTLYRTMNLASGLAAADPSNDIVVLDSSVVPHTDWLANLQYATSRFATVGVVGARLLDGKGRIASGGMHRDPADCDRFAHRFRGRAVDFGPATVPGTALAISGSCLYITCGLLDALTVEPELPRGGVELCLRAWEAGWAVVQWPGAVLETQMPPADDQAATTLSGFWRRWGPFFDDREVRTPEGGMRVVYVTEDTGVGGGHRDIFEHLNRLRARGHEAELWTLGDQPDWFDLQVPVLTFEDYEELVDALAPVDAIKVATWWNTAAPVWQASVLNGIPVYFVQDIETSYYANNPEVQQAVLASYRHEFRYMTISSWNQDRLRELGLDATLIPPGIDLDNFHPEPGVERRRDMILALGRSNPLKNLPLTLEAWRRLPQPRPELCLFGIEPELANEPGVRYVTAPSDTKVNELFNQATVFVQTSVHEGFCLPPLESMATGGAVVCTDAHGNRDFCRDGENCLMPAAEAHQVAVAITRLLTDHELRAELGRAGIQTASEYAWNRRIDALGEFLADAARPRRIEASTDVVPEQRR